MTEFGPNEPFIHGDLIDIHGVWLGDYDPDGLTPPEFIARAMETEMTTEYETLKAQGVPLPATSIGFGVGHLRANFNPVKWPYDIDNPEGCLHHWNELDYETLMFESNVNVRWSSVWRTIGKGAPWYKAKSWISEEYYKRNISAIVAMMERSRVFYRQRHS